MTRKHRAPFLADGLWRCTVNRCGEYVTVGEMYRVATADSASASRSVDFRRADGAGTYANERMLRVFVRQGRLAFERVPEYLAVPVAIRTQAERALEGLADGDRPNDGARAAMDIGGCELLAELVSGFVVAS